MFKKLLHAGSGSSSRMDTPAEFRGSDWGHVRFDADEGVCPDVLGNLLEIPFDDGHFDAVYCSHALEHVASHEVGVVLSEFVRVLCPSGKLVIVVPNIRIAAGMVANGREEACIYVSPAGPIEPLDVLYGHRESVERGGAYMQHRTGFTRSLLEKALSRTYALEDISVKEEGFDLWATARKRLSTPKLSKTSVERSF